MFRSWRKVRDLRYLAPSLKVAVPELKELEARKKSTKLEKREEVEEYYDLRQHLDDYGKDYKAVIQLPTYSLPFLQPGRLVHVQDGVRDFGWGAVIHFEKRIWPIVRGRMHAAEGEC